MVEVYGTSNRIFASIVEAAGITIIEFPLGIVHWLRGRMFPFICHLSVYLPVPVFRLLN